MLPFVLAGAFIVAGRHQAMAADCGDGVVVLGARGSGQPTDKPQGGLGTEVNNAYNRIRDRLQQRGIRARFQAVDYPAEGVLTIPIGPAGVEIFLNSITIGVNNAITQLLQIQNGLRTNPACAGPRIVLAGYSQGAMVMHRALEELNAGTGVYTELLGRIGAADHDHDTAAIWHSIGADTPGRGRAIRRVFRRVGRGRREPEVLQDSAVGFARSTDDSGRR
ncbi:cutinase family protein [Nocardia sp. GCM10030253]|uniref:cutinase family protein n=1 Tax=Nocardia sp. GCM10030253 TaxID=3273404 RepID=UPI003627C80F